MTDALGLWPWKALTRTLASFGLRAKSGCRGPQAPGSPWDTARDAGIIASDEQQLYYVNGEQAGDDLYDAFAVLADQAYADPALLESLRKLYDVETRTDLEAALGDETLPQLAQPRFAG